MDLMVNLLGGLQAVADPWVLLFVFLGAIIGLVFGAAPGLTATSAIVLFLPVTYAMGPVTSMALLLGIYCSGYFAGSIPAILINTPGAPGSAATALDGYALAQAGQGDRAIVTAISSSFVGGLFSLTLLALIAPSLARVALSFTSVEYFTFALVGIVCVAGISKGSMMKGLTAAFIGILASTVGLDPVSGVSRFTFGEPNLLGGIPTTAALIGLFAVAQMMLLTRLRDMDAEILPVQERTSVASVWGEMFRNKWLMFKSATIGALIGILPGTGPSIASWVSYSDALRTAGPKDRYGKGDVKGVISCEVSNNAVTGGALVPLLTLGIPGDPVTAVLIGALLIQGIEAGPFFIPQNTELFYAILVLLLCSNILMLVLGLAGRGLAAKVLTIPHGIMVPVILVVAAAGTFSLASNPYYLKLVIMFGVLGYLMVRFKIPTAPAVLGIVLGPILEQNLRNALTASRMDPTVFITRPISAVTLAFMCLLLWVWLKPAKKSGAHEGGDAETNM
ncbi:tripartite tricarboxylate transporter permease [Roseitranquillus sediminis]|uniref:tripartite tricarboxylate transporter permease n=1 Tax=Roseitranquillus sediminis TaxID=2809051 RepID=UPI001D0C057F|nr:tripartite tricarboxylate transporter permease [Roseitranquillus sediminis]MBM9593176.1 tripartite tricarboxylate transporter permease [Roseitranquillus sediminis]